MKKNCKLFVVLCLIFFTFAATASAAIMSGNIKGIDSELIESFTLLLEVGDDFSLNNSSFGSAIPSNVALGWLGDFVHNSNILTISNANWDYLFSSVSNPLKNGQLFSIDYTGSIVGFTNIEFFDYTGLTTFDVQIANLDTWLTDENVNFVVGAPVPIPGAFYLLGTGLIGIVGLKRKINI